MATRLDKTAIRFNDCRIFKRVDEDGVDHYHITAGYRVSTTQGEEISRDFTVELQGANRSVVLDIFARLQTAILNKEGI